MALDTDLSLAPYFNDFDANSNQYAVLYRPGVPVQAREMNQVQSILQDQIDKFGRNIYKEGSVVEGCSFTYDPKYYYVKIKDTYANGSFFNIADFVGHIATNSNGLEAEIVNAVSGFEAQDPNLNTLYLKYRNSGTYSNGASQNNFASNESLLLTSAAGTAVGNVVIASVANAVGQGYALSITDGVIFKKGYFIRVASQTAVVKKYNNYPDNLSVGFGVIERIETPASNSELYDNAQGAPNYGAPGAHRLKLTPTLITRDTDDTSNTAPFFSICDFKNGKPINIKTDPSYSALGKELARRTFETNGDFVVNPFLLTTEIKKANNDTSNTTANSTHLNLVTSPGLAYPKGYRVEFINKNYVDLRKGLDKRSFNARVSTNYGHYIYVDEFVGDFNTDILAEVELHSVIYNAVTNGTYLNTSYLSTKKIGTAYIRGIEYANGIPGYDAQYIMYLFNIKMDAGYNFNQVRSIVYQQSSAIKAVADLILQYDLMSSGQTLIGVNTDTNLEVNQVYTMDTGGGSFTATLPTSASDGDIITIIDGNDFSINNLYIDPDGKTVNGSTDVIQVNIRGITVFFIYNGAAENWLLQVDVPAYGSSSIASATNTPRIKENTINSMVFPLGNKAIDSNTISNASFIYRNRSNTSFSAATANITILAASGTGSERFKFADGTLSQSQLETFILIPSVNGYSTNNTGTVAGNSNSTIITGSSSTFLTHYRIGDTIRFSNTTFNNDRTIITIVNNTVLTVNSAPTQTFTGLSHQLKMNAGKPINMLRTGRSITISGTTATLNINMTPNAEFNVSVYHDVERYSTVCSAKNIRRNTLIKIQSNTHPNGTTGPWCLGLTDVFKLNNVWITTGSYSNTGTDSLSAFTLDDGQKDSHYDLAFLKTNLASIPKDSLLLVSVDHFTHDQTYGKSFFVANSYPIDNINGPSDTKITTAQIPRFTSPSKGSVYDLRDCVDFRPYVANTADMTQDINSATVNPAYTISFYGAEDSSIQFTANTSGNYIPSPNELFEAGFDYYLARRDRIALSTGGELVITEGIPDTNPRSPAEDPGTMALGIIDVPPYPTLAASEAKAYNRYDYAPTITLSQIKRFTMADIGTLANRITNLEYYTSLSMLEQSTKDLQVRSGTTGQNRFKNGILVDPFRGHDIGNTLHPQYSIAIDPKRQEARPFFRMWNCSVYIDRSINNTGFKQTGEKVTLDFAHTLFQQQAYASKYHNCIEGNIYNYKGLVQLIPSGDTQPDRTTSPDVINNLDLASNFINLDAQKAWGTTWGNWVSVSSSVDYGAPYKTGESSTTTNPDGSITTTYYTNINTTTTTDQVRTGANIGVGVSNTSLNLGTYVTDINVKPYVRSKEIFFTARGLKPNTIIYPYFNNTRVSSYCKQMYIYAGTIDSSKNVPTTDTGYPLMVMALPGVSNNTVTYFSANGNNWGSTLKTDSNGVIHGLFAIPANTFKIGDIQFRLTDISDLSQGEDAIGTDASVNYLASGLSVSYGKSILNTKSPQLVETQVKETRIIQQNSVTSGPPVVITEPPPAPPTSTTSSNTTNSSTPSEENGWTPIYSSAGFWGGGGGDGGFDLGTSLIWIKTMEDGQVVTVSEPYYPTGGESWWGGGSS